MKKAIICLILFCLGSTTSIGKEPNDKDMWHYLKNCHSLGLSNPDSAHLDILKFEAYIFNHSDPNVPLAFLKCKAKYYWYKEEFDISLELIMDQMLLADSLNNYAYSVSSRHLYYASLSDLGEFDLAMKAILQADSLISAAPENYSTMDEMMVAHGIGSLELDMGNLPIAEIYLKKFLNYEAKSNPEKIQRSMQYWNIAHLYFVAEKVDSLVKYRDRYTTYLEQEFNISSTSYHIGALYENSFGLFDIDRVLRILPELKRQSNFYYTGFIYRQMARYYFEQKEYLACIRAADSTLNYLPLAPDKKEIVEYKYKSLEALGDFQKAFATLQNYISIEKSLSDSTSQANINELQIKYDTEKKERSILDQQVKLKNANSLRNVLFAITAIISLLLFALWQRYKRKLSETAREKLLHDEMINSLELKSLRAQMNPHFLFNTLNSINWYIIKNKSKDASKYLTKFSKLMRQILDNSRAELIALKEELESLQLYVDLEAIRFEGEFDYAVTIDKNIQTEQLLVPPLIFQPFVENAIWHGLLHKEEKGTVKLKINISEDYLVCIIEDDGVGRKAAMETQRHRNKKHRSRGIDITKARISTANPESPGIEILDVKDKQGTAKGTKIIIKLPLKSTVQN